MLIKMTILRNLRAIFLLLLVILYAQLLQAQINDTIPVTTNDTMTLIKKLIKANIAGQLQQCGTYKKIEQIQLKKILRDSTVTDSLGKLILKQVQQLKSNAVNTGKSV